MTARFTSFTYKNLYTSLEISCDDYDFSQFQALNYFSAVSTLKHYPLKQLHLIYLKFDFKNVYFSLRKNISYYVFLYKRY